MRVSLQFALNVEEEWPPVGSESLPFDRVGELYRSLLAPLFVSDLSVGDEIEILREQDGFIEEWQHRSKSDHTTLWIMKLADSPAPEGILERLVGLGCSTTQVDQFGMYSVDVPGQVSIADVDAVLEDLDSTAFAVAFPSMRHPEPFSE